MISQGFSCMSCYHITLMIKAIWACAHPNYSFHISFNFGPWKTCNHLKKPIMIDNAHGDETSRIIDSVAWYDRPAEHKKSFPSTTGHISGPFQILTSKISSIVISRSRHSAYITFFFQVARKHTWLRVRSIPFVHFRYSPWSPPTTYTDGLGKHGLYCTDSSSPCDNAAVCNCMIANDRIAHWGKENLWRKLEREYVILYPG